MTSITLFTREFIKTAKSKSIISRALQFVTKKPTKAEEKGFKQFKKSLVGRAVGLVPGAVKATGKAAKHLVTVPVKGGKKGERELSLLKPLMIGGAAYGGYEGFKKGRSKLRPGKLRQEPYYSSSEYTDPTKRIY
jgi:hypothetical protein